MALISLNLAGGECVDDLQTLILMIVCGECFGWLNVITSLGMHERRRFDNRFRKGRKRNTLRQSVVFRLLAEFQ